MEEHDVENCKCIELNTCLLKFINDESLSSCELIKGKRYFFTILNSKLFISNKEDNISIIDLRQPGSERTDLFKQGVYSRTEQVRRKLFSVYENVTLMLAHDNTLVIAIDEWYDSSRKYEYQKWLQGETFGCESDSEDLEEYECECPKCMKPKMYYKERRIIVWNHESLHYVSGVNVLEKLNEFTSHESDGEDFEVHHFAMATGKLVVNIEVTYENSLRLKRAHTQIWKLDTVDPSIENIHYLTTIDHGWREDEGFILDVLMNSKFLAIAIENTDEDGILNVYLQEDLSFHSKTVIQENKDYGNMNILLDKDFSNKIAVLNKRRNHLKVYKIDGSSIGIHLEIDLSHIVVEDSDDLLMANYMVGKIMIIHESESQFQNIIVNEDGEVIQGTTQKFQEGEVEIWDATFCADGIVVRAKNEEKHDWRNTGCTIISFYHQN